MLGGDKKMCVKIKMFYVERTEHTVGWCVKMNPEECPTTL